MVKGKVFCGECIHFKPRVTSHWVWGWVWVTFEGARCEIGKVKQSNYEEEYWEYPIKAEEKNSNNDCKDYKNA